MDRDLTFEGAGQFPTLFDMVEARFGDVEAAIWWGPMIGADGLTDSTNNGFAIGGCVVQDGLPVESDRRLKEDITDVGTTVYGLRLYRFRYRDREGIYEGVMADDVVRVKPSAVSYGEDGFLRVDYRSLGLEMRQVA